MPATTTANACARPGTTTHLQAVHSGRLYADPPGGQPWQPAAGGVEQAARSRPSLEQPLFVVMVGCGSAVGHFMSTLGVRSQHVLQAYRSAHETRGWVLPLGIAHAC